jgi:putative hydrolase of the HAD superfamily
MIEVVAFDGDDTLWHNESIFSVTQERYRELMAPYVDGPALDDRLLATERRNLARFGYGVKSFTLSMIETAIEVSEGRVGAQEIQAVLDAGKSMLEHPVDLLYGAADAVDAVSATHAVMLITKGDLFDQESKLARSGLGERFTAIEIVSEKDSGTYQRILERNGIEADRFLMVGNSLRSDVAPVLEVGGWAVHVPYYLNWALDRLDDEEAVRGHERFHELDSLDRLPGLLADFDVDTGP